MRRTPGHRLENNLDMHWTCSRSTEAGGRLGEISQGRQPRGRDEVANARSTETDAALRFSQPATEEAPDARRRGINIETSARGA